MTDEKKSRTVPNCAQMAIERRMLREYCKDVYWTLNELRNFVADHGLYDSLSKKLRAEVESRLHSPAPHEILNRREEFGEYGDLPYD